MRVHDCNLMRYMKTRITMLNTYLHSGQLPPSSATRGAQFSQNLACPQGTKAKPSISANKHTSQHRNGVSAAAGAPGTDAAADALAAVGVNCSSTSLELSACWLGCSANGVDHSTQELQCVVRTTVLSLGEHTYAFKVIRALFEKIGATV